MGFWVLKCFSHEVQQTKMSTFKLKRSPSLNSEILLETVIVTIYFIEDSRVQEEAEGYPGSSL